AQRHLAQRHAIADARLHVLTADDLVARLETFGSQHVRLLAVLVLYERDARGAVGVVLDGDDLGPDAILTALEVDEPILTLVPAAPEARRDDALVVAAALFGQRHQERLFRLLFAIGQVRKVADRTLAAARRRRFVLTNAHDFTSEAVSH